MTINPSPKTFAPQSVSQGSDKDSLSPFHRALAEQVRPMMFRIEELLPDIEEALAKGYSLAQVAKALKAEDIHIAAQTLATYLHRLRLRRKTEPLRPSDQSDGSAATPAPTRDESTASMPPAPPAQGSQK
jgi:hypothetical protein